MTQRNKAEDEPELYFSGDAFAANRLERLDREAVKAITKLIDTVSDAVGEAEQSINLSDFLNYLKIKRDAEGRYDLLIDVEIDDFALKRKILTELPDERRRGIELDDRGAGS